MFVTRPRTPFTTSLLDKEAVESALVVVRGTKNGNDPIGRIKKLFKKAELSVSPYDTSWVAKIAAPTLPQQPFFPECLNWLLKNQLSDGSWLVLGHYDHLLVKESLMSTLACIVVLRQWEIGEADVEKGMIFLGLNIKEIIDKNHLSSIGFNIIFPDVIDSAKDFGLDIPVNPDLVDKMLHRRDLEIKRVSKCNAKRNKAYVCERLLKSYNFEEIIKYQMKNGSVLKSPSATASLLIRHHDAKGYEYLRSLLGMFPDAVPTIYPTDVHTRLSMVDRLQRLGIDRHFKNEIKHVLDETYRFWLQRDKEIFLDIKTCATAFRLLWTNGYEISSDALAEFVREERLISPPGRGPQDIYSVLELYKAAEIMTSSNELDLEQLLSWTSRFLKQELLDGAIHDDSFHKEVEHALKFTYNTTVERLENRRYIESYYVDNISIPKASYRFLNIDNRDLLQLAVEDYNFCQSIHQKELKHLQRWVTDSRLDSLKFARQRVVPIYFYVASILFTPELSDAREAWTKNIVLITVVDDLFDVGGSREELVSLIKLVKKWDGNSASDYLSEQVEIIFLALHHTIQTLEAVAFTAQGRSVTRHLIDIWIILLNSMLREHDWASEKAAPSLDEYMNDAYNTIGVGAVLITLYFLGPKLSKEIITSPEYNNLYKHAGVCCRLLNDLQSFKRESTQGKLNSVLLYSIHEAVTEEEAMTVIKTLVDSHQRDLLGMVMQTKGSVVPKACKQLLWNTTRITRFIYGKYDGFNSPTELTDAVNAILHEPIKLPSSFIAEKR